MSSMTGWRLRGIAVAGVATVLALSLAGCGDDTPAPPATTGAPTSIPTSIPSSTSGASTPPTSSLTSSAGQLSGIPVYWIGESRKAFALFRE
ncbi:MAG TPA: hypothetical protein VFT81_01340, partial [Dermatophilaceae bacterium]|nr:hypothetical protein [Dermatophilaceae bacterium]